MSNKHSMETTGGDPEAFRVPTGRYFLVESGGVWAGGKDHSTVRLWSNDVIRHGDGICVIDGKPIVFIGYKKLRVRPASPLWSKILKFFLHKIK